MKNKPKPMKNHETTLKNHENQPKPWNTMKLPCSLTFNEHIPKIKWIISAVQKIKKLSETPVTVHNIAKLCVIDGKNREITKKLVQPVPPPPLLHPWEFQWENDQKNKMAKNHFSGVQNGSQSV